jgi:hypothetical protein
MPARLGRPLVEPRARPGSAGQAPGGVDTRRRPRTCGRRSTRIRSHISARVPRAWPAKPGHALGYLPSARGGLRKGHRASSCTPVRLRRPLVEPRARPGFAGQAPGGADTRGRPRAWVRRSTRIPSHIIARVPRAWPAKPGRALGYLPSARRAGFGRGVARVRARQPASGVPSLSRGRDPALRVKPPAEPIRAAGRERGVGAQRASPRTSAPAYPGLGPQSRAAPWATCRAPAAG